MCEWVSHSFIIHTIRGSIGIINKLQLFFLLSSDGVVDGIVNSLLEVPSPSDADRAAVPGVDEVGRRHLLLADWICGVEDSCWVARSSHRLLGCRDEYVEDGLRLVERPAGPCAEVLWHPLSHHLVEVDWSCERGFSDDSWSGFLGGTEPDGSTSELVGISDVVFNWFLLFIRVWTRLDED